MKLFIRFEHWITAWLDLICSAINIITFCYYRPWWDYKYMFYISKKRTEKNLQERKANDNFYCG